MATEILTEILKAANLISQEKVGHPQKEVDRAIRLLESLDEHRLENEKDPNGVNDVGMFTEGCSLSAMKHLQLAIAYGKRKEVDRSEFHYRKAIEYGHPTGFADEKLAILLTKQDRLEEAIGVCQRLIDQPPMRKRKEKLEARLAKRRKKD